MKKNSLFVIIAISILFWSCKPSIEVINISDSKTQIEENGLIYHLPRTVYHVEIVMEHEYVIPGPFYKYANKYLSINNVPFDEEEYYSINEINLLPIVEADPDAVFMIFAKKDFPSLTFTPDNILCGVNVDIPMEYKPELFSEKGTHTSLLEDFPQEPYFTNLSVKRNFIDMLDTTYKVVEIDSVFQKIPVYNTVIISKDDEQKAEEAANFIIKLRKRRFKLEAGLSEINPSKKVLDQMINTLNKLEQDYLDLFTGKHFVVKEVYSVLFIPELSIQNKDVVLCWFSDEDGISDTETATSRPININCKALPQTEDINEFYSRQLEWKPKAKGIFYRIPGKGKIVISDSNYILVNEIVDIPQFGIINSMPIKMFKKKSPKILINPTNGSIISLH